ncbi:Panacea domain-containing protein [Kocuria sp. CNJ-770]|uniref:Panacea domain-containing protein n=1 Tax=Kocuria sp. CNJ-770 TaxID=1904964 RepID=UPI002100E41C|nr:Panacea domain-containing protein [Kocuria sp. CNJ-770]
MTTMKLQKLCYYSQGWHLAWDERPLFADPIQAWANGPVIYSVFDNHRGKFTVDAWPYGDAGALTPEERETVDAVLEHYGDLTGQTLSDMTHEERPWKEARGDLPLGARCQTQLSLDTMQDYFGDLASAQ